MSSSASHRGAHCRGCSSSPTPPSPPQQLPFSTGCAHAGSTAGPPWASAPLLLPLLLLPLLPKRVVLLPKREELLLLLSAVGVISQEPLVRAVAVKQPHWSRLKTSIEPCFTAMSCTAAGGGKGDVDGCGGDEGARGKGSGGGGEVLHGDRAEGVLAGRSDCSAALLLLLPPLLLLLLQHCAGSLWEEKHSNSLGSSGLPSLPPAFRKRLCSTRPISCCSRCTGRSRVARNTMLTGKLGSFIRTSTANPPTLADPEDSTFCCTNRLSLPSFRSCRLAILRSQLRPRCSCRCCCFCCRRCCRRSLLVVPAAWPLSSSPGRWSQGSSMPLSVPQSTVPSMPLPNQEHALPIPCSNPFEAPNQWSQGVRKCWVLSPCMLASPFSVPPLSCERGEDRLGLCCWCCCSCCSSC
mmetsp:Transcript_9446/g.24087  ORF Transcript_9446/g.24087 Transcript_9446/m.24087 type:complete len:408 (+) Transcript_9446:298-1521(+)